MSETIVVLSDLHANARALRAAVQRAESGPMDRIIVLGDLLTYGVDIEETLEIVDELERRGAVVIAGNHDEMYFDGQRGSDEKRPKLPDWINESFEYTLARLPASFAARYAWKESARVGQVALFHANPYAYGDWTYLSSDAEIIRAVAVASTADALVCGHTHRAEIIRVEKDLVQRLGRAVDLEARAGKLLLNSGSVGQPRHKNRESTLLRIRSDGHRIGASIENVRYDVAAHIESIGRAALSEATRRKLISFFVPDEQRE